MNSYEVKQYQHWLSQNNHFGARLPLYGDETDKLFDELFNLIKKIKPNDNGIISLWLRAKRGTVEEYGTVGNDDDSDFTTEEEREKAWLEECPDEEEWFAFDAGEDPDNHYRMVMLRHRCVYSKSPNREKCGFPIDAEEFAQWMIDGVNECIGKLEAGTYNDFIANHLPPQHRTGTILRKHFWDVYPEMREDFFAEISDDDVEEFCTRAYNQTKDSEKMGRLKCITANDFYSFCAMGYAANHYERCEKTPKEQYYLHADGRDGGLRDIDPDSPQAFIQWLNGKNRYGNHPWEVCRGGNSTHVALCVVQDEQGYYLILSGDAWSRTIETVKFYLALRRAGVPVYLNEAYTLANRLHEVEKIGIVPEGVIPVYCESRFPEEHIIDYINLPIEDREKLLPYCVWQKEPSVYLNKEI